MDLQQRKEEYEDFENDRDAIRKKNREDRKELVNLIAIFRTKRAVVYQNQREKKTLVIIKDCENCLAENIGIASDFLPGSNFKAGQPTLVKRSSANMNNFNPKEIGQILEFLADSETKISTVRSIETMSTSYRWEYAAYKEYFQE